VRLLRFATIYHEKQLRLEIQDKWITRLESDSLAPMPTILLAEEPGSRVLPGRALHPFLVNVESPISNPQGLDIGPPSSHQLVIRVFSGYHALQAYRKDLCDNPLKFREEKDVKMTQLV
jgi:hypothetical protein